MHVAGGMKHSNHLQRFGLVAVDDQAGIDQEETVSPVGQLFPNVTDAGSLGQSVQSFFQSILNTVSRFDAVVAI